MNFVSEIETSGSSAVSFKTPFFDQSVRYVYFVFLGALVVLAVQFYLFLHIREYSRRLDALRTKFKDDATLEFVVFPWSLSFAIFGTTLQKCVFLFASSALPIATQFVLTTSFMNLYGSATYNEFDAQLYLILMSGILAPIASIWLTRAKSRHLGIESVAKQRIHLILTALLVIFWLYYMYLAITQ